MFRFNPSPQKIVFSTNPSPRCQQSVRPTTSKQTANPYKYRHHMAHYELNKQAKSMRGAFLPLLTSQIEFTMCSSTFTPSDVDGAVSMSRNRGRFLKMGFIDLNSTTCLTNKLDTERNYAVSQFQKAAIHRLRVKEQIKQRRKLLSRSNNGSNNGVNPLSQCPIGSNRMRRGNSMK